MDSSSVFSSSRQALYIAPHIKSIDSLFARRAVIALDAVLGEMCTRILLKIDYRITTLSSLGSPTHQRRGCTQIFSVLPDHL